MNIEIRQAETDTNYPFKYGWQVWLLGGPEWMAGNIKLAEQWEMTDADRQIHIKAALKYFSSVEKVTGLPESEPNRSTTVARW